jgi:hypothetical protein
MMLLEPAFKADAESATFVESRKAAFVSPSRPPTLRSRNHDWQKSSMISNNASLNRGGGIPPVESGLIKLQYFKNKL